MGGRGHKQATDWQIADLRRRVSALEATDERVLRYRWFLSDRVLHRFITARNGNIDVALGMLVNHLIWRESYGIDTILDEDLSDFDLSKVFFWCGFDRGGRPCLVYRVCEHIKPDSKKERPTAENKVRFFCQLLEQGFRDFAPAYKFCLIVDCRDASSNILDLKLLEVAKPILEDNFPETQHSTYIVPWNAVAMMAWKAVSSVIDPGTADKVRLVSDFEDPLLLEAFMPGTLKAISALNPSRATPQPYVDPDPLSLPPPMLGVHQENARHPTSSSMFSSFAARRLSTASLVALATKPPPAGKGRSLRDESLLATGKLFSGEGAHDDEGKDTLTCPSAATAVHGSMATTEGRSLAPPSPSGSSENRKPRGTYPDDASLWLSGSSRYSRLRYSEAPESWEDDLFSPSSEGSIVTPDANSLQVGVTSPPRMGLSPGPSSAPAPSPSPSSAPAPSPSPSSAYPPPSPGGASDEDFGSARFDDDGVDSILDERHIDMVSTARERFDPQEHKQKRSPGSSKSGSASPATTQTLGATPEEQSAPLAGATPGAVEQQQQQRPRQRRQDPRHATDLTENKTGFVARQEVRRESNVVKDDGCVAHHAGAEEIRQTSSSTEWKEKTGYLYKRRNILKGRFAHRQRFAILRFPPTAAMTSMRSDDGAKRTPPAPTLTLLENDQAGAGKMVSLEGAEVTLGTAMAGDLFPFVVSFPPLAPSPPPSPDRRRRGGADDKPREKRRNTDDFIFMGIMDSSMQSADEVPVRRSSSGTGGSRRDSADGAVREAPWGGCDHADGIGNELSSPHRGNGNVSLPATRKTLHLACDTQEKTLGWARWIADAAALYEAALEAASNEERGGEGRMGVHVATSSLGSSPLLGVPAAVEDCWPRRTGADGFARGASGTGAKAQRGDGEKISSAGARRFLHVLDSFRRCTAAGCLAHGITPGGPPRSSASSLYTPSPVVRAGVWRGLGFGNVGESLLAMRDTEISRLRRSYARSEVSRWEMTRCLRALAVQLRDEEARTGALLADREAARRELSAKEAELARQKAFTEDTRDKALVEARSKETLVSSLRVENRALQAALERVRLELQEERELLERDWQEAEAEGASASVRMPVLAPLNGTKKVKGESGGRISRNTRRASHLGSYLHPSASRVSSQKALPRHSIGASPVPLSRASTRTRITSTSGRPLLDGDDRHPRSQSVKGLLKNFGGIGSRFQDVGRMSKKVQGMAGKMNEKIYRPCILNMDQTWVGAIRPPLQVLDRLLDGLEDVLALVGPWDEQGVLTSEAFIAWSGWTGELQRVPALESVDLPGEKRFTEGCLQLLRSHAAMVLGKKPDQLTGEDESRMAYAIGDGVYTISRLFAHLGALTAGLPTE